MAKRRAEDTLLCDSLSKKRCRPLPDMRLDSTLEGPPSVLALLGSRCRKRSHCFLLDPEQSSEEDGASSRSSSHGELTKQHAACALSPHASGSFQDRLGSSTAQKSKKRPRLENKTPETVTEKTPTTAVVDGNSDDVAYNSFQYWRVPLPALDLSLLEDENDHSKAKEESKGQVDAMET